MPHSDVPSTKPSAPLHTVSPSRNTVDRRHFVRASLAATASTTLATINPRAHAAPDNRPRRVGLIGTGWYGKCDLLQLLNVEDVEVVSLCDVDSQLLQQAADLFTSRQKSGNRPQTFGDWRQQLANVEHDAMLIATPDHWHALPMIASVNAGLDVYCQKPTGVDVLESQAMLDATRKNERVVQIGTQRRSTPHLMQAKREFIDTGLLGDVAMVEICCYYHMRSRKTKQQAPDKPAPDNLDWDLWTGPAPMLPYNDIVHPRGWRAFQAYCNGIMGDMCVHMFDLTRWMLDLGWPKSISSNGGILVDTQARATITDTQHAVFHYDDLEVVWTHRSWGSTPDSDYPWSAIIYGDKGTLKLSVQRYDFIPHGKGESKHGTAQIEFDKFPTDKIDQEKWRLETHVASAIREHMRNWLQAIDQRGKPVAEMEQGHISSACCLLANLALRLNRTLTWDPETRQIVNDDQANQLLKRPYRQPWTHPYNG